MTPEEKYKEELKAAGVALPEAETTEDTSEDESEAEKPESKVDEKSDTEDESNAPITTKPEEPRKRSIYDDFKDEKKSRKEAESRAEQLGRDNAELRAKIDTATDNKGADIEAGDDAIAYAKKVGADPALVERIIKDARAGSKPEVDETLKKDLEDFKAWRAQNSKSIEQQMFNDEFERTVPTLKDLFPTINDDSLKAVRQQLDAISHSQEWHDKPLDYIAFKHKDQLAALVSPKKRGMESKSRKDTESFSTEFDPEADLSRMTFKERDAWEAEYKRLTKSSGLVTGSTGKKLLI